MKRYTFVCGDKLYSNFTHEEALEAGISQSAITKALTDAVMINRKNAFKDESDPLYMEWQYDQTPEAEEVWRTAVAAIKARYPLPTPS